MTTTPAMPELPEGVTLEDLMIPLRAALDTCHDTDWTLRQFKTHITHALSALATLQAQPAAHDIASAIHYPDCWDQMAYPTLESALHELTAWFKCSNDECAQPAAVSDEPTEAQIAAGMRELFAGPKPWPSWEVTLKRVYQAMFALRPQSVPMTDEQIRSMCKQGWVFETVKQWVSVIEAHHGITAGGEKQA